MTKLTHCFDKDCPINFQCLRYSTPIPEDSEYLYFMESPMDFDEDGVPFCEAFWGGEDQDIFDNLERIMNGEDV